MVMVRLKSQKHVPLIFSALYERGIALLSEMILLSSNGLSPMKGSARIKAFKLFS
jgi:hypothetical protein